MAGETHKQTTNTKEQVKILSDMQKDFIEKLDATGLLAKAKVNLAKELLDSKNFDYYFVDTSPQEIAAKISNDNYYSVTGEIHAPESMLSPMKLGLEYFDGDYHVKTWIGQVSINFVGTYIRQMAESGYTFSDAQVVHGFVIQLIKSRQEGILPDLSHDLTHIDETTL